MVLEKKNTSAQLLPNWDWLETSSEAETASATVTEAVKNTSAETQSPSRQTSAVKARMLWPY